MSLSMKDKSNRKKRYILAGIFLGIATLFGIERCVNDEPESEQRIEQKTADKAPSQSSTPQVSSSLDRTDVQSIMKVFLNVEHSATNSMSCFRHSQLKYSPCQKQFFPKAVRLKLVNNSTNCFFRIVRTDMVGQPRILS